MELPQEMKGGVVYKARGHGTGLQELGLHGYNPRTYLVRWGKGLTL